MLGYSFYGKTEPRWLFFLSWLFVFLTSLLFMFSPGMPEKYLWFSLISGLIVVVSSIRLKSVLLFIMGVAVALSYYCMAFMFMATGP